MYLNKTWDNLRKNIKNFVKIFVDFSERIKAVPVAFKQLKADGIEVL